MSMPTNHPSRRSFLQASLAAGVAGAYFTISGTKSSARVIGANDTIRVAVCGINGRGKSHIDAFAPMKNVQVAALVDPDSRLFDSRIKLVRDKAKNEAEVKTYQDVRKALDDADIDAVSIATCNHWHSPIAIWAVLAGKDVYVEKPISHNVREGRILADLVRKTGRIVQHGTQSRGSVKWAKLAGEIADGKHGKLLVSRGTCFKPRESIGMKAITEVPAGLDFDIWTGPAPKQAFHENLVHYNWHWFWDFGNGDIGNQGVHQMDIARWMIPNATFPKSVISFGGRFGYKDQGQTPNTQVSILDYGDTLLVFEVRGLKTAGGVDNDQTFDKDAHVEKVAIKGHPGVKDPAAPRFKGGVFENFIDAIRSRKAEDLDAHALEGHYSAALCHMANISYRLGTDVPYDKAAASFADNKKASELLEKVRDHLKDNAVTLDDTTYRVGRLLKVDVANEAFVGDDEANKLLTRVYRAPYTIPDRV
jgi:predicted dehydrogenase